MKVDPLIKNSEGIDKIKISIQKDCGRAQYVIDVIKTNAELTNVEIIHSDRKTGLPDYSIDVALLYDILHDLSKPNEVLEELHRVLKTKWNFIY